MRQSLFHRNALSEVSWLVYVAASSYGYVVGEELEGDYFEDGEEEFVGLRDVDYVFYKLLDVVVAIDGYGDDAAGAGGYFLDVGEGLFVL